MLPKMDTLGKCNQKLSLCVMLLRVPNRIVVAIAIALIAGEASARIEVHYAPTENLEAIDVDLIDTAETSIDMAAYVLSDQAVIDALNDAAERGVTIRIYLDKGQFSRHGPREGGEIEALLSYPNVFARVKGKGVLMHLKAYLVDGAILRTGSGNFSHSGLHAQDNDLVLVDDPAAIAAFERNFDVIFARATNPQAMLARDRGGPR
jgi:phosphatidylserine/phosphatidylglycerophosphate/cardiolipin synthase-like enzyme